MKHVINKLQLQRVEPRQLIKKAIKIWYINGKLHRDEPTTRSIGGEDGPAIIDSDNKEWWINNIKRDKEWVEKYLKIRKNHILLGVIVSDKWKIREIILRWIYNPNLQCVKKLLKRVKLKIKIKIMIISLPCLC
jgi:hypothetical protein